MESNIKQLNTLLCEKYGIILTDDELFDILDYYSDFIIDLFSEDCR